MASPMLQVAVVVACVLCCGVQGARWNDPCNIRPYDLTEHGGEVTAPSHCTKGSVEWHYPQGTLQVNFHTDQHRPFTVCLTPGIGPLLNSVAQLVGGQKISVRNPQNGQTVCLPRADHRVVTVLLEQPTPQTYMTMYDFHLLYQ
ncbi:hypothetical protein V1264_000070 [Littorina saxatilis]|uniref:Uncharacterized protein n=1 Tax=Littorina saxatilis TaxID=31220 RepID=A0AAN9GMA6_9CAEN